MLSRRHVVRLSAHVTSNQFHVRIIRITGVTKIHRLSESITKEGKTCGRCGPLCPNELFTCNDDEN